jgi:hypothetical protein
MTLLEIVQIVAAVLTLATGAVSLLWPRSVLGFTGLAVPGPRGVSEIRSILGGGFVGLGAAPLILGEPAAYRMLGITYLIIGVARAASIVIDHSTERSNLISLGVEIILGVLLIL